MHFPFTFKTLFFLCDLQNKFFLFFEVLVSCQSLKGNGDTKFLDFSWAKLLPTQENTLPKRQMAAKKIKVSKGARTVLSLPGGI